MKRWIILIACAAFAFTGYSQTTSSSQASTVTRPVEPVSLEDIKELSQKDVASSIILKLLQNNPAIYTLTAKDVSDLHSANVKQEVIDYLLSTPRLYQTPQTTTPPPPQQQQQQVQVPVQTRTETVYVPTYVSPPVTYYSPPRTTWHIDLGGVFGHHGGHHGGHHFGFGHHGGHHWSGHHGGHHGHH